MTTRHAVAALIGAVVFVLIGYMVFAAGRDGIGFAFWLARPIRFGVWAWAMVGAVMGPALLWLVRR